MRLACLLPVALSAALLRAAEPVPFTVKLETLHKYAGPDWQWFHPRPAAIPRRGEHGAPLAVITIQKHLHGVSDYYSGLYAMLSRDLGKHWEGPREIPELGWATESDAVDVAVADVTPGWHAPTGKLIAVGAQVRYSKQGTQLDDRPRSHQTSYTVFDPRTKRWAPWRTIAMPDLPKFNFARSACAQWLVRRSDGAILLPFYFGINASQPHSVTVAEFRFDGRELRYVRHGTEFELNVVRGLVEPSLVEFQGKYYLTIRNDLKGYVTSSPDGLGFEPIREWRFDDGAELGSYNTQQHWLAHSDGLFLAYTRRGAGNDHVIRHRAPLFLAQVDPLSLRVLRATEKILMPERGATFGNFGAAAMTETESWVTDTEGMFGKAAKERGAEGATYLARVLWGRPNRSAPSR